MDRYPPPHVPIIITPFIRLEALDNPTREQLARQGLNVVQDEGGYDAIRFTETEGGLFHNQDFIAICLRLNASGLAFGEDYRQGFSPADIMRELRQRGAVRSSFMTIAWRGPDDWFTEIVGADEQV